MGDDGAWQETACIPCECNCGIEVQLGGAGGRHITRIRGASVDVVVETRDTRQPGHVSLPDGLGSSGIAGTAGVAPNELTASEDRDRFAGTPWHEHVPARVEAVA